jgi:hypothetical protein
VSQPPPWGQGQPSDQGDHPSPWPSADQPPAWPSAGSGQEQPPAWPSGGQPSGGQPSGGQPSGGQPSGGQPSVWPSAGSGQEQPPSWPPAGQPPYPGPGYTYGYGPRPPRFRRRPRFLGAIITLAVIIVVGVVVGNLGKSHENVSVSVTPFPSGSSASAGRQEPPGRIGSSFELEDGSGNLYQVTLTKGIDPAKGENQFTVPDAGKRFVGLVFRVKALTGSPQDEDANNNAVILGSNGQKYAADFEGIAGYTNFDHGAIHVSKGETVTGSVTFQLPKAEKVSTVQWTALSGFGSTVEWIGPG